MPILQLFYVGRASQPYDDVSVRIILAAFRRNNPRDDITVCLSFSGRYFAQVLVVRPEVTSRKLDTISSDPRHVNLRRLVERRVVERTYAEWSKGYCTTLVSRTRSKRCSPTSRHPQTSMTMSSSGCSQIR